MQFLMNSDAQFIIYPQLSLKWNPQNEHDKQAEVPDFRVGNFTLSDMSLFQLQSQRPLPTCHVHFEGSIAERVEDG